MALSLTLVDELIAARQSLHGGEPGAPTKLEDGQREGSALNRACVVMLSSALQAFIGDVFVVCSEKAFGRKLKGDELEAYNGTWSRWGNPNPGNIVSLFLRLGVTDVFDGLSWQKQSTDALKSNLDSINQIRNRIAHGEALKLNGSAFSLRLANITRWRSVAETFGNKFEKHALGKIK